MGERDGEIGRKNTHLNGWFNKGHSVFLTIHPFKYPSAHTSKHCVTFEFRKDVD
jgi:hypothetical protein